MSLITVRGDGREAQGHTNWPQPSDIINLAELHRPVSEHNDALEGMWPRSLKVASTITMRSQFLQYK